MKIKELKIQNFRGYRDEATIGFDDLTVIIGRNDSGKSSLLDAMDVFFNDASITPDDACVSGDKSNVRITCVFDELPSQLILDDQHATTLQDEFLTREDGLLEVCKVYNCSLAKPKQTAIFAKANHPSAEGAADLLTLKIAPLKIRANELEADLSAVNLTIKTQLRKAIWSQCDDLALEMKEVDLSAETGKTVWDQIQIHLPVYALFKSDRASTDQDGEAQDPMKAAIKEAVKGHEEALNSLLDTVRTELETVAAKTVEKIQEMSPDLANSLMPTVKTKAWDSLFSVSLSGDDGISINKRGSGTRRLVLLNFFRAKAEDSSLTRGTGTIYAVEEPETSQHPNFQLMLLDAFRDLTTQGNNQVILTTHTPTLARKVNRQSLRFISSEDGHPSISHGNDEQTLHSIKASLGVLPDHDVKVFIGVEGKWDIEFFKRIARVLRHDDPTIPDLDGAEASGWLVFIPLGGSSMELWTSRLANLERPEIYFTDRDDPPPANPKYHVHIAAWNARANCSAHCTTKRELENYLHPDAIRSVAQQFPQTIADFDDVPMLLAEAIHCADPNASDWNTLLPEKKKSKASNAKKRLNRECAEAMTPQLLQMSDPHGEIESWLRIIDAHL